VATASVTAGLGFLAGILWLDLIFDAQMLGMRERDDLQRAEALNSVSAYYRHALGGARRLDVFIAVVMMLTLAAIIVQWIGHASPAWVSWTSLIATVVPISIAAGHTIPSAKRLAATPPEATGERQRLARSVLRDHIVAFSGILLALSVQLAAGR